MSAAWLPPGVHPALAGKPFFPARPDKRPAVPEWRPFADRLPTEKEIAAWKNHTGPWGMPCGPLSFVAVDFDGPGGKKFYEEKFGNGTGLPPTAMTPSGGYHAFFEYPKDERIIRLLKNAVRILPDVDLRVEGGYVIIPTDDSPDRCWLQTPDIPAPPLPDWIIDALRKQAAPQAVPEEQAGSYDGLPPRVNKGERNKMTSIYAGRYLARGLSAEETATILVAWNKRNPEPLPEDEIRRTVFSIAKREAAKTPSVELFDSSELTGLMPEEKGKIIEPFFPIGGKAFLAAWQGSYKSTMMLNWAVCINNNLPIFERFNTIKGRVLYIDRENPIHLVNERIERISRGLRGLRGGIKFDFPKAKPDLADRRVREAYIRTIEKGKFDFVIFDSFLCFFNLRNENDNTEVRNVLELVGEIPARTGAAILFLDHAPKPTADKIRAGIKVTPRGAGAKGDWADLVVTLEERVDEARTLRTLRFNKTRFTAPMPAMIVEVRPDLVMVPSGFDEICPVFTVRQTIEDNPGIPAGKLYDLLTARTGASRRTAMRATARAVELQMIHREETGRGVTFSPRLVTTAHVTNDEETKNDDKYRLLFQ